MLLLLMIMMSMLSLLLLLPLMTKTYLEAAIKRKASQLSLSLLADLPCQCFKVEGVWLRALKLNLLRMMMLFFEEEDTSPHISYCF